LFGVASLALFVIGLGVNLSRVTSIAVFMVALAVAGGLGACLRLTRAPGANNAFTAMVVGAVAGAVFSLSYMVPHWMSNHAAPFALGTTPGAQVQLMMTWLVALGGGLAADAVIDSLRRGGEQRAQNLTATSSSAPLQAAAGGGRRK
jgi:hypothetical protein